MNEKQRTRRIQAELEKMKAELARQEEELAELEEDLDPADLEDAEQDLDELLATDEAAATFAESLRRISRPQQSTPNLAVPAYAVRV